ncbi:MAG: penicillin-binding protein 1C [Bacteroidales bacterium]|nr:penicillin-binding protein 1C [Bacteroidales bacterium]MCI2121710.1 penicillin-binding protein 1C [Bacteroidales bacterium]MCI2145792.1 penicillin-binding protein 1C [Bacteroidales bacterium]
MRLLQLHAFYKKRSRVIMLAAVGISLVPLFLFVFLLPGKLFDKPRSTILYSSDGTLAGARIAEDGQWRFPECDTVPQKFAKAIVECEDKRFYIHPGVDFLSVGRAAFQNMRSGRTISGASTITMQTIRLMREGKPRTLGEKCVEAAMALRLELRCSKRDILALYASNAPFGGNVVGLEAASERYFGRKASTMSWAEAAMLAVLPNSPSLIHPGKNRGMLLTKRNALLDNMAKNRILSAEDCMLAKNEPLPEAPYPIPDFAYHYLEKCRREHGDAIIHSSIDLHLQKRVNRIAANYAEKYSGNFVNNMAVIVLDVKSGNPLAYFGNVRRKGSVHTGGDVDIITSPRSSGSTLKPFLYAAMIDEGTILPTMLIDDTPLSYKDFSPHNYSRTFDGAVPACEVIERSLNVPSVRMLDSFGIERFLDLLKELGFSTVDKDAAHYGLSLILGGAEITLRDLAQAYRDMAFDLEGGTPFHKGIFPLSRAACWLTFEALSELNRPEEESSWRNFPSSRKVAWKTGTSWGNRDAWAVGVTPEYVVGVWVGNADGEGRAGVTGVGYAAPVMFDVFSALPPTGWFEEPVDELKDVEVCSKSGFPVSPACESSIVVKVPAKTACTPGRCPYHRIVHLSPDMKYVVDSDVCPVSEIMNVPWFVLPPTEEWYYERIHPEYKPLPPLHPLLALRRATDGENPVEIIYPVPGQTIIATRGLDGRKKGAVFRAADRNTGSTLFWHLDGKYIGSTTDNHNMLVIPSGGKHVLTLVDQSGARQSVTFYGK